MAGLRGISRLWPPRLSVLCPLLAEASVPRGSPSSLLQGGKNSADSDGLSERGRVAGSGATRPGRLPRRLTAAPQERDPSVARSSDFSGRDRNLGDFVRAMSFKSSRRRSQGARLAASERAAGGVVRPPPPSSSQTRWPPPCRASGHPRSVRAPAPGSPNLLSACGVTQPGHSPRTES